MIKVTARIFVALAAGVIFGFGLSLSGMLDPTRVRGFLDIAGHFDPSLAFVLAGAVAVSSTGYLISRRLRYPLLDRTFHLPVKQDIDLKLITGAAIFGVGWGMGGLCPGPAIASLALGLVPSYIFTVTMFAGILIHDNWPPSVGRKATGCRKNGISVRTPVRISSDHAHKHMSRLLKSVGI